MMRLFPPARIFAALVCVWALCAVQALAQSYAPLALDGTVSEDGTKIEIRWSGKDKAPAQVFRRELGQTGIDTWTEITPRILTPNRILDTDLPIGHAYEYQVMIAGAEQTRVGYWAAGDKVPARTSAGTVLLVIDQTLADDLAAVIDRFEMDLIGAGWQVERHLSPRGQDENIDENLRDAHALRAWIARRYQADPAAERAIILIGHVPVVRTGWVRPDGHDLHAVPSDLFYADPVGNWPVMTNPKGQLQLLPRTLPADHIKMPVGRIDFSRMSRKFGSELGLLTAYFDRNHHWRQGELGDLRKAYGQNNNLIVERNALRNIVGPANIVAGGHHDTAGKGPFLLGVDFGHWKGEDYVDLTPSKAIFTINFGSGKHDFDRYNNAMVALLAQPGYPLSVAWGGRPSWQLHGMALGESIGQAQMRTVNNGAASHGGMMSRDYVPTGNYDWINPPWVNLLGDPTLEPFPLPPATDFTAKTQPAGMELRWTLPEGADDALLFRAETRHGPYLPMAGGQAIGGGVYLDPDPLPGGWYMVRAQGLAKVYAGSFYRLSQGAFATAAD